MEWFDTATGWGGGGGGAFLRRERRALARMFKAETYACFE